MAVRRGLRPVSGTELTGRDWELSLLVERARDAAAGAGQAVLLRGPGGIGKTKLVASALEELDAVASTVLAVSCPEAGATAYSAVRALFEPLDLTGDGGAELLTGSAQLALPALLPDRADGAAAADTYSVMHGLHWLTEGLTAAGLVVLAVDDVQWCDETSLRWLGFLLHRAENLPLLVVMTQRTGMEVASPAVLGEIGATLSCLTVDLEPLRPDAVADVLRSGFGVDPDPEFVSACTEVTGGNPFLLDRVVTRLRADAVLPDAGHIAVVEEHGRQVVARSLLDRLPPDAGAVAQAIAVLRGEDVEMVAALAGTQPGPAAGAIRALRTDQLLLTDRLDYSHDLIRQAVTEAIAEDELARLREHAATLLSDSGRTAEEVAVHLLLLPGPPQGWMVGVLRAAAVSAETHGAPATAARYLTKALTADQDDVPIRVHLARVLAQVDPYAALAHLEHALDLVTHPRQRVPLAVSYTMISMSAQNSPKALALAASALDDLETLIGPTPHPADQALRTVAQGAVLISGVDEKSTIRQVSVRFRDTPPPDGDTTEERQMLGMLCGLHALEGRPAEPLATQAERVLSIGDVAPGGWAVLGAVLALHLTDRIEGSLAALDVLVEHAQRRGEVWTFVVGHSMRALVHLWGGHTTEALADAETGFDIMTQEAWGSNVVMTQASLAAVLTRRAEPARALRILNTITRQRVEDFALEYHWMLMARARALAGVGDLAGAVEDLHRCRDSLSDAGISNPVFAPWWYDAAELLADLGRGDEALPDLELAEEQVARWGTQRAFGMARTARGILVPGDAGIDLLAEAADILAESPARLEHAHAEYLLGRRLLRRGDTKGSRDRLRRSIDVAVLCQDKQQLDLSLPALAEAGGRMHRGTASPADALSGSERRVAEKAGEGRTNRETAESLFLTVRTVELHLTNIYRKLGLTGRAELADALRDHSSC